MNGHPSPLKNFRDSYPLSILIAEDFALNQKLISTRFKMLGYTVHIAENGIEVLEVLSRIKIDIIFMDIHMPEMDGLQATQLINERWGEHRPLIVAMSTDLYYNNFENCIAAGMDDFIGKPFRVHQVINCIERWASRCKTPAGGAGL